MSNYDDFAESAAFIAGHDTAREVRRDGVGWGPLDGDKMLPRGLYPDDETTWMRGWRTAWE